MGTVVTVVTAVVTVVAAVVPVVVAALVPVVVAAVVPVVVAVVVPVVVYMVVYPEGGHGTGNQPRRPRTHYPATTTTDTDTTHHPATCRAAVTAGSVSSPGSFW